MEFAMTTMSRNGQIVIPAEVRKDAKIGPATKFLVANKGGKILLTPVRKQHMTKLFASILEAEEQIKRGEVIVADTEMSAEEIDELLMHGKD